MFSVMLSQFTPIREGDSEGIGTPVLAHFKRSKGFLWN